MMFKAKNFILVHAMSRSGQHPVIDWIYHQFNDDRTFFNYMKLPIDNSFQTRSQYYFNEDKYFHILNNNWAKYGVLDEKLKEFKPETTELWKQIETKNKNLLMMNFENIDFTAPVISISLDKEVNSFSNIKNVLIVRDIFNYLASKIKMGRHFYPETNLACWKIHAREYLGITNVLPNKVLVNFNKWVQDIEYKKLICKQLDCDLFLPEWYQVSSFGGGSSFDHQQLNGQANKMKVLERWREYKDNKVFTDFLKDKELIELSEAIFGVIPGTETFK